MAALLRFVVAGVWLLHGVYIRVSNIEYRWKRGVLCKGAGGEALRTGNAL